MLWNVAGGETHQDESGRAAVASCMTAILVHLMRQRIDCAGCSTSIRAGESVAGNGWNGVLGVDPLTFRGDLPGVEAGQVEPAVESGVFDFHALIHDDFQAEVFGHPRGLVGPDAQL